MAAFGPKRAEKDFKEVRAIDPQNRVMMRGEALLSMEAGDLENAINILNTRLKQDPGDTWSSQTRADAYQQNGDFEKARVDRERLPKLSEGN